MAHMNHASTITVQVDQRHLLPGQFYSFNKIPVYFKINKVGIFMIIGNLFSDCRY